MRVALGALRVSHRQTAIRHFSTTRSLSVPSHPVPPDQHDERASLHGPISDHAKEAGGKVTGVPEETEKGKPPPEADIIALLAHKLTPDLFSLANRTIIVTGGGRGLGLAVAEGLLECGANVAAVDLLPEPSKADWDRSQETAKSRGLRLTYDSLDVTNQDQVHVMFAKLYDEAPQGAPVRGLFTAAGIQMLKSALEYTPEQIRQIIDVNLTGSFLCAQAFAKEWIQRNPRGPSQSTPSATQSDASGEPGAAMETGLAAEGGASIVFTGSMSGHIANFGLECAAYNASKAGVNQLARSLAMEWGKRGIRVNSLSPGYIRTAMTAALLEQRPSLNQTWLQGSLLGRLSTQDEFRGPVTFLLSDASSFCTGSDLRVDGGHTAT